MKYTGRERAFLAFVADYILAILSVAAILGLILLLGGLIFSRQLPNAGDAILAGLAILGSVLFGTAIVLAARRCGWRGGWTNSQRKGAVP